MMSALHMKWTFEYRKSLVSCLIYLIEKHRSVLIEYIMILQVNLEMLDWDCVQWIHTIL